MVIIRKKLSSIEEMAQYIGKIVKKYSSKKNILVGHSMGSLICLSMAMNNLCNAQNSFNRSCSSYVSK